MVLDIPRNKMPQIFEADVARDYGVHVAQLPVHDLVPVQSQRLAGIVKKAAAAIASGQHPQGPIMIDKFNRIINGHHRYDAYKMLGFVDVPVLIVEADIFELIDRYQDKVSNAEVQ